MMKIALVDDEVLYLKKLKEQVCSALNKLGIDYDIHSFHSGKEFLDSDKSFDLIYLDIEMPIIDGINTAKLYRERHNKGLIIFLTNHMEMIQSGYLVNAFRFIEKNGRDDKFNEALQSAIVTISDRKKELITTIDGADIVLEHEDILYIEAADRGIKVVTIYDIFFSKEKISDMRRKLGGSCFYQSHRAFIVNLNHILRYDKRDIYLKGGHCALLSVKKTNEFKEVYYNWKFQNL
ncbi:MAG: response regulator transcription factor [Clostridiales bacterium]|jgi:two-component system LytT family response regulator|nr:response regulator transcription factor [Clostridiales bacterium]